MDRKNGATCSKYDNRADWTNYLQQPKDLSPDYRLRTQSAVAMAAVTAAKGCAARPRCRGDQRQTWTQPLSQHSQTDVSQTEETARENRKCFVAVAVVVVKLRIAVKPDFDRVE